jgi:hypothetical protein
MKVLTRADFFSRRPAIKPVFVPLDGFGEDGGDVAGVYVKMMNAAEREKFETFMEAPPAGIAKRALFAQLLACDEKGQPIFTDADLPALSAGEWRSLDLILDAGMKLNVVTKEQKEQLKKTSSNPDTGDGSSGSAPITASSTPTTSN